MVSMRDLPLDAAFNPKRYGVEECLDCAGSGVSTKNHDTCKTCGGSGMVTISTCVTNVLLVPCASKVIV